MKLLGMSTPKTLVKNIVGGAITGAVQSAIPNNALGGFGDALAPIGVGAVMKNHTLQSVGGYQLGIKLASGITGAESAVGGVY